MSDSSRRAWKRCAAWWPTTAASRFSARPWSREDLKVEARPLLEGLPVIEVALVVKRDAPPSPALEALKVFLRLAISLEGSRVGHVTG